MADTAVAADWPGYTVLDLPPSEWSMEANDAFVGDAIDAGQDVYLASPLSDENLYNPVTGGSTIFGRELQQFLSAGYTPFGDYLLAPR